MYMTFSKSVKRPLSHPHSHVTTERVTSAGRYVRICARVYRGDHNYLGIEVVVRGWAQSAGCGLLRGHGEGCILEGGTWREGFRNLWVVGS